MVVLLEWSHSVAVEVQESTYRFRVSRPVQAKVESIGSNLVEADAGILQIHETILLEEYVAASTIGYAAQAKQTPDMPYAGIYGECRAVAHTLGISCHCLQRQEYDKDIATEVLVALS